MSFKSKVASFFRIFGVCLLTISIPAMLILYGLQAKKYKDLTKEVVELERKQEKLIEENKRIVSEISVLTNAERIEKIAVEELGMHKAEAEDIVRVEMTGEKK
jgi:cell division protein FtsL